ncbi:MAG: NADH-quinone oxidoreductase subunit NuoK [Pelagibacterales bacterium]|nr:NADH-quinone oxidoreductase subunit NuoK [Pelagibacterales bacterium]OUU63549.1 MAG: NADH-quinone oxidoreductase subunit K [Alphaproteobacteria bacterium TMED62]|tara:strand:- start:11028 stop:11336 length:309 start_codon:yes stop_codon:yes gene_type:complete
MQINPTYFTLLSALLFSIGMLGIFLNRRSIIIILMSIELLLLSVNINLVAFSAFHQNLTGQVFTMFVLTVAAAEAAIGLAILVVFFRNKGSIRVEDTQQLKG